MGWAASIDKAEEVKKVKNALEDKDLLRCKDKIVKNNGKYQFFTTSATADELKQAIQKLQLDSEVEYIEYESDNESDSSLEAVVANVLASENIALTDELRLKIPSKWSKYPPMILFKAGTFDSECWNDVFGRLISSQQFFLRLLQQKFPDITHLAVNKPIIESDVMRRPFQIQPLYGDFGPKPTAQTFDAPMLQDLQRAFWCHVVQNGIYQTWSPTYTMFSRGNIKEKARIVNEYDIEQGDVALDLYAGIGYFTLSYLKRGCEVFCWEINPWSVHGLVEGVKKMGVKYRLISRDAQYTNEDYAADRETGVRVYIFHESNDYAAKRMNQILPLAIAHINLGLLPSSQLSWPIVCEVVSRSSKNKIRVHVHENVGVSDLQQFQKQVLGFFQQRLQDFAVAVKHLEKVKTFAPDVWHTVVDVDLSRESTSGCAPRGATI